MKTIEKLTEILRMVFENEDIIIHPETTANDVDGWDSLSHVNLILAIEEAFNIRFTQKELLKFKNINDLLTSIESKTGLSEFN